MDRWEHYFAFGSNMSSARLHERIPRARALGCRRLCGWRFAIDKSGRDGSAKANIHRDSEDHVWGVVFEIPAEELSRLDVFEGGYVRTTVEVLDDHGRARGCHTYCSERTTDNAVLFTWYKRHLIDGATEHQLPASWRSMLEALPARSA